jgi:hypothetical protein
VLRHELPKFRGDPGSVGLLILEEAEAVPGPLRLFRNDRGLSLQPLGFTPGRLDVVVGRRRRSVELLNEAHGPAVREAVVPWR